MEEFNMSNLALVPLPRMIREGTGVFRLTPHTPLAATAGADAAAEGLQAAVGQVIGWNLPRTKALETGIRLQLDPQEQVLGSEGYQLGITPAGVTISACAAAGLFYGTQTLLQLIESADRLSGEVIALPALDIRDWPCFGWRGFMLDCSRHYMTVPYLLRLLDLLAYHKLNRFHWHLTDSQGWRLQLPGYPELIETGAVRDMDAAPRLPLYYSPEEVRRVLTYAHARHIMVVPEIEMPGHCNAALAAYPELRCPGGPDIDVFCAGDERVFTFLCGVLSETCALFDAPEIHVGGDERSPGVWARCPKCQARMRELGIADESLLQTWFMRRITDHLARLGKRAVSWAVAAAEPSDAGAVANIGHQAIIQSWHGEGGAAARQGIDVIESTHEWVYFDYPEVAVLQAEKPTWMPLLSLRKVYAFDPIPATLPTALHRHYLGVEACLWTELVSEERADYYTWPRLCAIAETGWTPQNLRAWDGFQQRLPAHLVRLQARGVQSCDEGTGPLLS
jgi:hexosaminidase